MKNFDNLPANPVAYDQHGGVWVIKTTDTCLRVIASWAGGWDHVSVSTKDRCPTWDEMCLIKDLFFMNSECAVQYHPQQKDYINIHKFCLHLWRPQEVIIPMPPQWMI